MIWLVPIVVSGNYVNEVKPESIDFTRYYGNKSPFSSDFSQELRK